MDNLFEYLVATDQLDEFLGYKEQERQEKEDQSEEENEEE